MVTTTSFVRRVNRDSTIDSICTSCYRTVATSEEESNLVDEENIHVCEPVRIDNARWIDSLCGTA